MNLWNRNQAVRLLPGPPPSVRFEPATPCLPLGQPSLKVGTEFEPPQGHTPRLCTPPARKPVACQRQRVALHSVALGQLDLVVGVDRLVRVVENDEENALIAMRCFERGVEGAVWEASLARGAKVEGR